MKADQPHRSSQRRSAGAVAAVLLVLGGIAFWSLSAPRTSTPPRQDASARPVPSARPLADARRVEPTARPAQTRLASPRAEASFETVIPEDAEPHIDAVQALVSRGGEQAAAQLERIIREEREPYLRERAVFGLVEIRERASLPMLRELALRDRDPNVRSAALANFQLLKQRYPDPPKGELSVETTGAAHAGALLRIDVTLASQADVDHARLHFYPPPGLALASGPVGWKGRLRANQPERLTYEVVVNEARDARLPVSLTLAWSPLDYEQIRRDIVLDVRSGTVRVETARERR